MAEQQIPPRGHRCTVATTELTTTEPTNPDQQTGCEVIFETQFAKSYARNNKSKTRKNLLCFPACHLEGHRQKSFCGSSVTCRISRSSSSILVVGALTPIAEPRICGVGETISSTKLFAHKSETYELMFAQHDAGDIWRFVPRNRRWPYKWVDANYRNARMHCFRVYVFQVTQAGQIQKTTLALTEIVDSPHFSIISSKRKRAHTAKRCVGKTPMDPALASAAAAVAGYSLVPFSLSSAGLLPTSSAVAVMSEKLRLENNENASPVHSIQKVQKRQAFGRTVQVCTQSKLDIFADLVCISAKKAKIAQADFVGSVQC